MTQISKRFDALGDDGEPKRLGLMGGTFDPVHIGHLRIAEEVREALALDAVLFIPTGNPVFKRDRHVTDASVRLAAVHAAVKGNPYFDVSPIEVDRTGDTFTVDTLRMLRAHYPDNVQFYFIVGSDAAETIGKWRGCAEIAELTHLVVAAGRPGTAPAEQLRRTILEAAPFDLHLVQVTALAVSSSDIRQKMSEGKSVRYLVPSCARVAGEPLGQPGEEECSEALTEEFLESRKRELEKRVSPKRFRHSMGVSTACVELASAYGVDVEKARLAGLLHDWDKGYDDEQACARVYELGMQDEIDPTVVESMPGTLHGITAARALGRDFPCIPHDVLQAISRHTTAATDMSPLDMVLYIADAIEPNRQFGRIDELRRAVGKVTLEELYFQTYEYWVFLLFERRKPLHPDTITIWNDYTQRLPRKKKHGKGDGSVSRKEKRGK